MEFFPQSAIDEYVCQFSSPENELLQKLSRETYAKVLYPRMLSNHWQGLLLQFLSKMIKPKTILEIGTFTGYSAICLVQGLQQGGHLHTIEINPELENIAKKYFAEAQVINKITMHVGNALNIIPSIELTFDLVFIDADKINYSNYFDMIIEKVEPGGYILADNVLWSGKVLQPLLNGDKDTEAIINFNKKIKNDSRIEQIIIPVRDGLTLMRKL